MKINKFAQKFVETVNTRLNSAGEASQLDEQAQKKLQNLIIIAGNSLIGDVNTSNVNLLKNRILNKIEACPIDGFQDSYVDWAIDSLRTQLDSSDSSDSING